MTIERVQVGDSSTSRVNMESNSYDGYVDGHQEVSADKEQTAQNDSCTMAGELVLSFLLQLVDLNETNCSSISHVTSGQLPPHRVSILINGRLFYAYFTPVVFVIGIIGNPLSFCVFVSKNMRHLSASTYLAALSTSDIFALLFYVLIEWLIRGYPVLSPGSKLSFMLVPGLCQLIMYLHYVSRFLSSWLVVAFTVERYIGVCHPLRRRHICSLSSSRKIVFGIVIVSFLVNIFKPLLSRVQNVELWGHMCTTIPAYRDLSFILDSIYAVSITFVPFVIITILNIKIIRQLVVHNRQQRLLRVVTEESVIKLEFTSILLLVSFCFVALNLPYFVTWFKLFLTSGFLSLSSFHESRDLDYFRGVSFFTRAIFYINYCINFFLYSITGAYFRRELKCLVFMKNRRHQVTCKLKKQRRPTFEKSFRLLPSRSSDGRDSIKQHSPPTTNDTWV
ncbi:probable G-protein coupled receptor 139 [Biomphalaria glabrata]|uniref:Probable G-protein coupled receptor 139 n=1 Tax=Biomphalaria glabrata TaxID=6526 RepID=A0A9W2ZBK5_BIOGL|nr:probable G-protein coupled receptor 139 [Biomphalaria glabrata]